ncbi:MULTISPECIES: hypothetical protein [unclassified Amycolatopsis]|uniref:hypothetical protein n=1 Tax=unclassified Amycolatopsis TaxID=2618356 RepID=UPI002E1D630A|nr:MULTISPECIES: hypothetical protein [unclassified Amycolatopsis]
MTLEITGGRADRPGFAALATRTARWTRRCAGGAVTFGHPGRDTYRTPRVWSGHGVGLPEPDLAGFAVQLAKVMKDREYWIARAEYPDRRAGDAARWSPGRYDDEDGFVYFAGPCTNGDRLPGYHPAPAFTIPLPFVRGLRIRLAAYLTTPR